MEAEWGSKLCFDRTVLQADRTGSFHLRDSHYTRVGFAGTVDVLAAVLVLNADQVALFEKLLKVEGSAVVR